MSAKHCTYAKSDMTPCFNRDYVVAIFDKGGPIERFCVGCERRVYPTNAELNDYDRLKANVEATKPKKRRRKNKMR